MAGSNAPSPSRVAGLALAVLVLLGALPAVSAEAPASPLRVGLYEKPPFVVRKVDGGWDGLAVALWREVALRADLQYAFTEVKQSDAIQELSEGQLDVLLGQMSVSVDRERVVDFSHAFLMEPLAAAFHERVLFPHWTQFLGALPGHGVYSVLFAAIVGLIVFAILFWIAERRQVNSHFRGRPLEAIGTAIWFSAVTMTTVGYGDKTPLTPLGRALAFLWMFCGILLISGFTATVASTVAAARTTALVFQVTDLSRFENGVLEGSAAFVQLRNTGIPPEVFSSVDDALDAVESGKIHALVADYITIRYELNHPKWKNLRAAILHDASSRMAIPVRRGLPELEVINVTLLEIMDSPGWQGVVRRWAGAPLPLVF